MTDEQKTKRYKSAFTKLGVEYPFEFKDETKLSAEERVIYQRKLRDYRDLFSVMETKFEEGKEERSVIGIEQGIIEMIKNLIVPQQLNVFMDKKLIVHKVLQLKVIIWIIYLGLIYYQQI